MSQDTINFINVYRNISSTELLSDYRKNVNHGDDDDNNDDHDNVDDRPT